MPLYLIKCSPKRARETESGSTWCDFCYFYEKKDLILIYIYRSISHIVYPHRVVSLVFFRNEANPENSFGTLSSRVTSPHARKNKTKRPIKPRRARRITPKWCNPHWDRHKKYENVTAVPCKKLFSYGVPLSYLPIRILFRINLLLPIDNNKFRVACFYIYLNNQMF